MTTRADKYNIGLAGEFYVLSCLLRMGFDASLTLGNKKNVDITVLGAEDDESDTVRTTALVEVKTVAGKHDWPIQNRARKPGRFFVLVSFRGKAQDSSERPDLWVLDTKTVEGIKKNYNAGRTNIPRSAVPAAALYNWQPLIDHLTRKTRPASR